MAPPHCPSTNVWHLTFLLFFVKVFELSGVTVHGKDNKKHRIYRSVICRQRCSSCVVLTNGVYCKQAADSSGLEGRFGQSQKPWGFSRNQPSAQATLPGIVLNPDHLYCYLCGIAISHNLRSAHTPCWQSDIWLCQARQWVSVATTDIGRLLLAHVQLI